MDLQLENSKDRARHRMRAATSGIGKGIARMLAREGGCRDRRDLLAGARTPSMAAVRRDRQVETGRKIVGIRGPIFDQATTMPGISSPRRHEGAGPRRHHGQQCGLLAGRRAGASLRGGLGAVAAASCSWATCACLAGLRPAHHGQARGGGRVVNLIGNDGVKSSIGRSRRAPRTRPGRTSPCRSPANTAATASASAPSIRARCAPSGGTASTTAADVARP